jgi:hypothetical protein
MGFGIFQYLVAITFLVSLLTLSLIPLVDFARVQSQTAEGQFLESIIASSSTDTAPRLLKLKATQQAGAASQEVTGFFLNNLKVSMALSIIIRPHHSHSAPPPLHCLHYLRQPHSQHPVLGYQPRPAHQQVEE